MHNMVKILGRLYVLVMFISHYLFQSFSIVTCILFPISLQECPIGQRTSECGRQTTDERSSSQPSSQPLLVYQQGLAGARAYADGYID
jgi:hypothetical protein